jgi:alkaline phosphatase
VLGLFERSHMEYDYDRPNDTAGEPSLAQMTDKAIDLLAGNPEGYLLMIEGGPSTMPATRATRSAR